MTAFDHSLPPLGGRLRGSSPSPAPSPLIVFALLVPVLIGTLLGATRSGMAQYLPWVYGIGFWVLASLAVWSCLYGASIGVGRVLRPLNPPLTLVLLAGAILGSMPARYAIYAIAELFRDQMQGRAPRAAPPLEWNAEFVLGYLQGWAGVYLTWVVVALLCHRLFGVPQFGPPAQRSATGSEGGLETVPVASIAPTPTSTSPPAFEPRDFARADTKAEGMAAVPLTPLLDRLPAHLGRHVLALEAEDHYVRVHTDRGSTLVLGRLSDAIAALGAIDGVRVHRSYWVRKGAVARVFNQGKGLRLRLVNGIDVPVSQAYKELARRSGLARDARS